MNGRAFAAALICVFCATAAAHADPTPAPSPAPSPSPSPAPSPSPSPAPGLEGGQLPGAPPEMPRWQSPFEVKLSVELPLLSAGAVFWTVPYLFLTDELPGPHCNPCDPNHVNAFDRLTISVHMPWARTTADVMLYALPPIFFMVRLFDYGISAWRGYLTDALIVAEAVVWAGLANEVERRIVRRPRPFMYEAGVYPDRRDNVEAELSYYSGHTSAAFAFVVATAIAFTLRHPHSPWRIPLWIGLITYAVAQGTLRVLSGDHFPTDVISGSLVGAAIGVAVPMMHRRLPASDGGVRASLRLAPSRLPDGGGMISLVGSF